MSDDKRIELSAQNSRNERKKSRNKGKTYKIEVTGDLQTAKNIIIMGGGK